MKDTARKISAVILTGGHSSRMGTPKENLSWGEKTLLQHQADKMKQLGIKDIIISGVPAQINGVRFTEDIYPDKGPLGGIHAGLLAAETGVCLVMSVDTPLVPLSALEALIETHERTDSRITVLSHGDRIEPTIAVYDAELADMCARILLSENTSVRRLLNTAGYSKHEFTGDERLLCDCNTPAEYELARSLKE